MTDRPAAAGVLETCVYCTTGERERVERFYADVLGLRRVAGWGDGTAFRVGPGVLLLFDRERLADRDEPMAAHGTEGPNHVCLLSAPGGYDDWKRGLAAAGLEIAHEHEWTGGRRSFYFTDPAGNLLEIADADLWPSA